MNSESIGFLRDLIQTPSPSGFEEENLQRWRDRAGRYADEIWSDAYGNTVATLNPDADVSVVVTGHSDEIGMMVNHITDNGYIYVKSVGGVDLGVLPGQKVSIHGDEGDVKGVVGRKPIHLQESEEREEAPEIDEIYIDIGAEDEEDALEQGLHVGSPLTLDVGFDELSNGVITGRGLDNRIGIWTACEVLRICSERGVNVSLHAVATVQEELGLKGAQMISYSLDPDIALVVDVTFATDVPGIDEKKHGTVSMGEGPTIKHGKENHPALVQRLREVGDSHGVSYQEEAIMSRGGTDADAFYVTRGGIPTAGLGVPNRNMHTPAELVHIDDLDALTELISRFVSSIDDGDDWIPSKR